MSTDKLIALRNEIFKFSRKTNPFLRNKYKRFPPSAIRKLSQKKREYAYQQALIDKYFLMGDLNECETCMQGGCLSCNNQADDGLSQKQLLEVAKMDGGAIDEDLGPKSGQKTIMDIDPKQLPNLIKEVEPVDPAKEQRINAQIKKQFMNFWKGKC